MLYLFSGDDTAAARKAFSTTITELMHAGVDIQNVQSLVDLESSLHNQALFSTRTAYVLENVLQRATSRTMLSKLLKNEDGVDVYIWEGQTDSKALKKSFPNARHTIKTLPVSLWSTLDSFYPGNLVPTVRALHAVSTQVESPLVLFMLQRRVKDMLMVTMGIKASRIAPWQSSSLSRQAARWGASPAQRIQTLKKVYNKLYEIEAQTKSGTLAYPIDKALDICACFYLK